MIWVYAIPQAKHLIAGKTTGLTLALWLCFLGYLVVGLSLSILAYREPILNKETEEERLKEKKKRLYTILIFALIGLVMFGLFLLAIKTVRWTTGDTAVSIVVVVLSILTSCYFRSIKDPMARGWLAVWCKGVAQLWAGYVMFTSVSSEWIPPLSMLATHGTMWTRFFQVYSQGKSGGWDRPTKGLMLGESSNVISWSLVTILWFFLR
jgi:uncharacterized membrane protein